MIDVTSLFLFAGLLVALVAGDAAISGDTLHVQITVPQEVSSVGFTEALAESVFTAQAAQIIQVNAIIPAPSLTVQSTPTVIAALATPLNLDRIVTAMQDGFGIDRLAVSGAILVKTPSDKQTAVTPAGTLIPGKQLDMVVVVQKPHQAPAQNVLEQPDGDAAALIKRAAEWSMEQVSPYRVVLVQCLAGISGNANELTAAKRTANRFLATPWDPALASERALTLNVLALLAMHDNNLQEAETQITSAEALPNLLPQARAELALNHSFLAVAQRRPNDAAALLETSRKASAQVNLPGFPGHFDIQEALITWANGDTAAAEAQFRKALVADPESDSIHHYLAMLLSEKGDVQGAAAEEQAAKANHLFDKRDQALAVLLFWTDPGKGGVTRRL